MRNKTRHFFHMFVIPHSYTTPTNQQKALLLSLCLVWQWSMFLFACNAIWTFFDSVWELWLLSLPAALRLGIPDTQTSTKLFSSHPTERATQLPSLCSLSHKNSLPLAHMCKASKQMKFSQHSNSICRYGWLVCCDESPLWNKQRRRDTDLLRNKWLLSQEIKFLIHRARSMPKWCKYEIVGLQGDCWYLNTQVMSLWN